MVDVFVYMFYNNRTGLYGNIRFQAIRIGGENMETGFKIDQDIVDRFKALDIGMSMSAFAKKATVEKIKRLEKRDNRARLQQLKKDSAYIEPIIMDVLRRHGMVADEQ